MGRAEVRRYYEDNTRRDALHAVDRRIAELLTPLTPRHLLDLGCGTGASALWLAGEQAAARGLTGHCRFLEADYLHIPELDPADAAYAIESFTHAETPGLFLRPSAGTSSPAARWAPPRGQACPAARRCRSACSAAR
jgi:hypothetical protein